MMRAAANEGKMSKLTNDARFWDRAARKYAASPVADLDGYERTLAAVRAHLGPERAVFEFGCGTGTTALRLASAAGRYVATDISPEMITIAREKAKADGAANVEFLVATPDAAPWPDASFDVALGFNILHLIAAREAALKGVHRLLKPGGIFISKTPCLKEMNPMIRLAVPVMQAIGKAPYVAFFSQTDLEQEIAAAGFEITERARHGSKPKQEPRIYLVSRKR
jgi:ubiquinone/menaquinone biosynthesis C-methylase UbiE